ncbi:hypothetical protein NLX86_12040 [Streptomyces sp. A3M-1-3]|uniref:hypothetical protein n=1 Tax=Streptomyces sp. A3M-1-3 TaxID=2962044 RepID=UPI0020B8E13F|nr:hypothetical protein [Streptomyces sp. A3M-1-3]MCP3818812.1 hypothetical protein [Streptomyces sp. A3M-1-3]
MSELIKLVPLLACPLGMGALMWFMMRAGRKSTDAPSTGPKTAASGTDPRQQELAVLRQQVDDLKQQMGHDSQTPDRTQSR